MAARPSPRTGVEWVEGLRWHQQIGLERPRGRCDPVMTEPQGDGRDVDPGVESMPGGRVSEEMGRDGLGGQTGRRG